MHTTCGSRLDGRAETARGGPWICIPHVALRWFPGGLRQQEESEGPASGTHGGGRGMGSGGRKRSRETRPSLQARLRFLVKCPANSSPWPRARNAGDLWLDDSWGLRLLLNLVQLQQRSTPVAVLETFWVLRNQRVCGSSSIVRSYRCTDHAAAAKPLPVNPGVRI